MFSIINITILALWLFSTLADYFDFTYYVQLKEYRWDRFRDFLNTEQGKYFAFQYRITTRPILLLIALFLPFNVLVIKYAILLILFFDFLHALYNYFIKKNFHRPIFTNKVILIIGFTILLEGGLFVRAEDWDILLVLMMTRIFILGLVVYFINKLSEQIKKLIINKARRKIKKYSDLIIIGITGSYGKTTTKEFLAHILGKKFKVVKTPAHVNTDYGIARFILKTNFSDIKIFIVEMGAYKKGDLLEHCYLVNPKIGILTTIAEQHLSIFGSIKNIQEAKYDLLRCLPADGLAITNSDNPYCREFLSELKCTVRTFGTEEEYKPNILVKKIDDKIDGCVCTVKYNDNAEITVNSPLRGAHNVYNVMPCVLVADYLGMSQEEIIQATYDLPQTIDLRQYGEAKIINDSYNSNYYGFKAALNYMNNFKEDYKRIVITRGMLELGEKSQEFHEKIAGEIAYCADELVIITPDEAEAMKRGAIGIKYNLDIKEIYDPEKLLKYFQNLKDSKNIILLENRQPAIFMQELEKNSKSL